MNLITTMNSDYCLIPMSQSQLLIEPSHKLHTPSLVRISLGGELIEERNLELSPSTTSQQFPVGFLEVSPNSRSERHRARSNDRRTNPNSAAE